MFGYRKSRRIVSNATQVFTETSVGLASEAVTDKGRFTCQTENVVYSIICRRCGCLYIGETGRRLRERFSEHLRSVRNNSPGFPVAEHFNSASHSLNDMMICGLKRCSGDNTRRKNQEMRRMPTCHNGLFYTAVFHARARYVQAHVHE